VILECVFEHRELAVHINFKALLGWVMDYRGVLRVAVLVFGHDVWSL